MLIYSPSITSSLSLHGNGHITGSLFVTGAISASFGPNTVGFFGTASWASNVVSASYITSSGVFGPYGSNSILSSSYALTASYALNSATLFPFTGNAVITGSLIITGSGLTIISGNIITPSITGSLFGTASWAQNAITASYAISASYITGSVFTSANPVLSASYALTASYALSGVGGSSIFTINNNNFNANGEALLFTGSNGLVATITDATTNLTASFGFPTNAQVTLGGITGSLFGTSSWAQNVVTASYVTGSVFNSTNPALSASFATTASFVVSSSFATTASFINGMILKSGVVTAGTFTGNPKKATVTFVTAFPNTNYSVTVTGQDARSWTIETLAAGSFVINANSNTALSNDTYWQAISIGEFRS